MTGCPSSTWAGMPRWSLKILGLVSAIGILLIGLISLNQLTRNQVRYRERYTVSFADIDCAPPSGVSRADFLEEAQYLGGLPSELSLLETGIASRLAAAFARHPWVEKVEQVEIDQPRHVRVRLAYRTPVLVVQPGLEIRFDTDPSAKGANHAGLGRMVDANGVLLPKSGSYPGLPTLAGKIPRPTGSSGRPWGDPAVRAAARTASYLRRYRDAVTPLFFEATTEGIVLSISSGTKILWGHAPGAEVPGEASAAQKMKRLLAYRKSHGSLNGPENQPIEYDVRPREKALFRVLTSPKHP